MTFGEAEKQGYLWALSLLNEHPGEGWLKVEKASLKILKKFNRTDSLAISHAIENNPSRFFLTDRGDVKCPGVAFLNKTARAIDVQRPISEVFYEGLPSIADQRLEATERIWTWDSETIMCRKGTYVLRKDSGAWHLLYNFIHRDDFKKYYKWNEAQQTYGSTWNGRSIQNTNLSFVSMPQLFEKYCSITVKGLHGLMYMDPACAIISSQKSCAISALLEQNMVSFSAADEVRTKPMMQAMLLPSDVQNKTAKATPNCVCYGPLAHYISSYLHPDSFMKDDFQDRGVGCTSNISINVCQTIFNGDAVIDNAWLSNQCGDGGAGAVTTTPETSKSIKQWDTRDTTDTTDTTEGGTRDTTATGDTTDTGDTQDTTEITEIISPGHIVVAIIMVLAAIVAYLYAKRSKSRRSVIT